MTEINCTLCGVAKKEGKSVVADPRITLIEALIGGVKTLNDAGFTEYAPFVEFASSLSSDEKKTAIRYHRSCRQTLMKRKFTPLTEEGDPGFCSPPKKLGRPSLTTSSNSSANATPVRRTSLRSPDGAPKPKEVYLCTSFFVDGRGKQIASSFQ